MAIFGLGVDGKALCETCHLYRVMSNKRNRMEKIGDNGHGTEVGCKTRKSVRFLIGRFGAQNKSNFGGVDLYLGFSVKILQKCQVQHVVSCSFADIWTCPAK